MADPTGEADKGDLRLDFNRRLLLQFRGFSITCDAGLTGRFGGSAEHPCSAQKRTIARTTRKSGEYRRIRGRTYCPGAALRQASVEFSSMFSSDQRRCPSNFPHKSRRNRTLRSILSVAASSRPLCEPEVVHDDAIA